MVFAIGLVIGFELLNTAIEYLVDIVSFEYSVKAKKVKDVAATATLVATLTAVAIGLLVFIPAIINFSAGAEPASNAISFMIGNIYV
ncbi:MAG: diacylglycerol kinase family protein [Tenericutes bacterium]|nr:MAG: diacylglycerol kinase family protein [Mycoplasmatota bacterium]